MNAFKIDKIEGFLIFNKETGEKFDIGEIKDINISDTHIKMIENLLIFHITKNIQYLLI